jgi:hypothetical protein
MSDNPDDDDPPEPCELLTKQTTSSQSNYSSELEALIRDIPMDEVQHREDAGSATKRPRLDNLFGTSSSFTHVEVCQLRCSGLIFILPLQQKTPEHSQMTAKQREPLFLGAQNNGTDFSQDDVFLDGDFPLVYGSVYILPDSTLDLTASTSASEGSERKPLSSNLSTQNEAGFANTWTKEKTGNVPDLTTTDSANTNGYDDGHDDWAALQAWLQSDAIEIIGNMD